LTYNYFNEVGFADRSPNLAPIGGNPDFSSGWKESGSKRL
jgi:hypothetical protein